MLTSNTQPAPAPPTVALSLDRLLERISDAFLAVDRDWRVVYLNGRAAQTLGRRREDLLGRNLWAEMPEDVGGVFYQACHRALAEQTARHLEEYAPARGRRIEAHVYPDADGLSIFFRDVTEQRETQRRLERSEQHYRCLFEQSPDAVFTFDPEGRFVAVNPACVSISGYAIGELRGMSFFPLIAPEDQARARASFESALAGRPQTAEIVFLHKDGRRLTLHVTKMPIRVDGEVTGVFGIAQDVTERRRTEEALRESEERMRTVAEASPVAMTITRWGDGRMLFANRHFTDLFGVEGDPVGREAGEFYAEPADRADLMGALEGGGLVENYEVRCLRPDGTPFWTSGSFRRTVYHGEPALFAAYHDVTERRRLLAEAIEKAERDPLTGLLNHRAFHKRYEEEARRAQSAGSSLAVAVLDLDNFKFFNDSYGHGAGDDVLRQVADGLRGACRGGDSLARFGGDEYALLLPDVGGEVTADEIAARLTSGLRNVTYRPPGGASPIPVSLSVGVALFPADAPHRSAVLELADERLLRAKAGGLSGGEARVVRDSMQGQPGFPMLDALVNAVDNKDRYTRRHSEDVLVYSLRMARALGMDMAAQRTVEVAALLHDVGKIGVPDSILRKPGPLTDEEFTAVKHHPVMGAVIVGAVPGLEGTLDAVRHHHEQWDGKGYPDGLAGEAIPLTARLIAVADAYSALTSDRPYRKGRSASQARAVLEAGAGSQWCPVCVAALLGETR